MSFKLTYATMFDPPEAMHERFESALGAVTANLGGRHDLFVGGADVATATMAPRPSPVDVDQMLGHFAVADRAHVDRAMAVASEAFPAWRATPTAERARLVRRVGEIMEQRVYGIAAALGLEVGKNRMEALGEAQETADFFHHYADDFESHGGFDRELPNDPLASVVSRNRSVMRPYGVWVVIAPFNFPLALAGGPAAAALVTGNAVVVKGASDSPRRALARHCVRDAGLSSGRFQLSLRLRP